MVRLIQERHCGGMFAAIFMVALLAPANAADKNAAEELAVAPPPSHFEPAAPGQLLLDPDLFKFSPAAPNAAPGKLDTGKFQTEAPGIQLPTTIDLGSAMLLRFDTSRNPGIRVGIDEKDPALLNPGIPTRKESPLTPSYFGFTFITPTH